MLPAFKTHGLIYVQLDKHASVVDDYSSFVVPY